ncbi:hypothetical protein ACHWQZ_G000379 [Mnemiopsis leidyi]
MSLYLPSSDQLRSLLSKQMEIFRLSLSFIFIIGIYILMSFVTLLFAGQIGQSHLAGVGLANTLYNIIVTSVSTGYSSVFDTYGPQVYGTGTSNQGELGTVLLKCLLQGTLVQLFLLGPYLNIVYIIDLLPEGSLYSESPGDDVGRDFRDIAVQYLRTVVVVEYLDYALMMISKYFAIQGYNKFVYLISGVMIGSHLLSNYVLVALLELEVPGLGSAAILGRVIPLAVSLTVCFVMVKRGRFSWNGFSTRALLGWGPMVKLGVSGAINAFAEMALFEISNFFSQFDGTTALSVVIIVMQIIALFWAITLGMSRASATLIGKALAEGDATKIRSYMKLSVVNALVISTTLAILSFSFRRFEVQIFSSESEVVELFVSAYWLVCLKIPVDHLQTMLNQGILVAFGAQKYTACTMSIASYGIGLPIILITIFFSDLKVTGIFLGILIVDLIMVVTASLRIWMVDISKEIQNSKARVSGDETKSQIRQTDTDTVALEGEIHQNVAISYHVSEGEASDRENGTVEVSSLVNGEAHEIGNNLTESVETAVVKKTAKFSNSKEIRNVLLAFVTAGALCVSLAGVSLMRQ